MPRSPKRPFLTTTLLRVAYAQGFFPMPHPKTNKILWFSPDPRAIIPLDKFHCSRSLKKSLRNRGYNVTFNKAFSEVMHACAARDDTWIIPEFIEVYTRLHEEGDAHSVEVWKDGLLVGGTYGVTLGGAFFAESMFHKVTDASKVALFHLTKLMEKKGFILLEVQFLTEHLKSLGAIEIPAEEYMKRLETALQLTPVF